MSQSAAPRLKAAGVQRDIQRLSRLLADALALVDELRLPLEIGARLQGIVDSVESCLDQSQKAQK